MNQVFCKRLKAMRKDSGKTQDEMAKLLKVRRSTYGEYERGKITPPIEKLTLLAEYFDVSVDYLFGSDHTRRNWSNDSDPAADVLITINKVIDDLENDDRSTTFDGDRLDDETRLLLASSLKNSIQMGKILKRGKTLGSESKGNH